MLGEAAAALALRWRRSFLSATRRVAAAVATTHIEGATAMALGSGGGPHGAQHDEDGVLATADEDAERELEAAGHG